MSASEQMDLREAAKKLDFALASAFFANLPDQAMEQVRAAQLELRGALASAPAAVGEEPMGAEATVNCLRQISELVPDENSASWQRLEYRSTPSPVPEDVIEKTMIIIDNGIVEKKYAHQIYEELRDSGLLSGSARPVPEDVVERAKEIAWAGTDGNPSDVVNALATAGLLTGSAAEMRERCAEISYHHVLQVAPENTRQELAEESLRKILSIPLSKTETPRVDKDACMKKFDDLIRSLDPQEKRAIGEGKE